MQNTVESHKTQSLYEAAFLMAKGFKLARKETSESGRKVILVFEPHPDLAEAVMSFYNNGSRVEPKALFDAYRTLKDYIFQR
jgi:hypothetical protein